MAATRVDHERLLDFCTVVYEKVGVPAAQGFDEVRYPGELEANNEQRNRRDGIEFPDDTLADLKRIAREMRLETRLPFQ